jgi:hypothetical protein
MFRVLGGSLLLKPSSRPRRPTNLLLAVDKSRENLPKNSKSKSKPPVTTLIDSLVTAAEAELLGTTAQDNEEADDDQVQQEPEESSSATVKQQRQLMPRKIDRVIEVPSYRQLSIFLATTVLIWLSEPVLSLVDTTVVGLGKNAIVQLASIGPATTLYDSLLYLTYFLAIATTNKLTKAYATKDYRDLQTTTSHVLGVAAVLGVLLTCFVFLFGNTLLGGMVGAGASASQLVFFATRYACIRASVAVASVMGLVMQAFCLATMDTKAPALAVVAASVVNVIGDVCLRRWGVQGGRSSTLFFVSIRGNSVYNSANTYNF